MVEETIQVINSITGVLCASGNICLKVPSVKMGSITSVSEITSKTDIATTKTKSTIQHTLIELAARIHCEGQELSLLPAVSRFMIRPCWIPGQA